MSAIVEVEQSKILTLRVKSVRPFKGQPRIYFDEADLRDLAASIKEIGQLTAIVVRNVIEPYKDGSERVEYEIIDGERRWRACQIAGIKTIRAEVRGARDADHQYVQSVASNFGRRDHTPLEAGLAVARVAAMPEYSKLTREVMHERVGAVFSRSATWAQLMLRMMSLPKEVLELIGGPKERRLNAQVAQFLVTLHDPDEQIRLARQIVEQRLNPPRARMLIRGVLGDKPRTGRPPAKDARVVFSSVSKIHDVAENLLDLPMPGVKASLASRPGAQRDLSDHIDRAIDSLVQLRQVLELATKSDKSRKGKGTLRVVR